MSCLFHQCTVFFLEKTKTKLRKNLKQKMFTVFVTIHSITEIAYTRMNWIAVLTVWTDNKLYAVLAQQLTTTKPTVSWSVAAHTRNQLAYQLAGSPPLYVISVRVAHKPIFIFAPPIGNCRIPYQICRTPLYPFGYKTYPPTPSYISSGINTSPC